MQTSWGSRADGDLDDNERMSPRARRSESIVLPPGNHPDLVRYNDKKQLLTTTVTAVDPGSDMEDTPSESDLDAASDKNYDHDDSTSSSMVLEVRGR